MKVEIKRICESNDGTVFLLLRCSKPSNPSFLKGREDAEWHKQLSQKHSADYRQEMSLESSSLDFDFAFRKRMLQLHLGTAHLTQEGVEE